MAHTGTGPSLWHFCWLWLVDKDLAGCAFPLKEQEHNLYPLQFMLNCMSWDDVCESWKLQDVWRCMSVRGNLGRTSDLVTRFPGFVSQCSADYEVGPWAVYFAYMEVTVSTDLLWSPKWDCFGQILIKGECNCRCQVALWYCIDGSTSWKMEKLLLGENICFIVLKWV